MTAAARRDKGQGRDMGHPYRDVSRCVPVVCFRCPAVSRCVPVVPAFVPITGARCGGGCGVCGL